MENINYITCPICKEKIQRIVESGHLKKHSMSMKYFKELYPDFKTSCLSYCEKLSVSNLGRIISLETRQKISQGNKGKRINENARKQISESLIGIKRSSQTKEKIRKANLGKKYSNDLKLKLSQIGKATRKKQIQMNNGIFCPSYSLKACEWFRNFDENNNTKGKYAVYGGGEYHIKELNYWLDYINFDIKLIMEYDENPHFSVDGKLKDKDIKRQEEIQKQFPDFEFRRITIGDIYAQKSQIDIRI